MKEFRKRVLCSFLAVLMVFTMFLPVMAYSEEREDGEDESGSLFLSDEPREEGLEPPQEEDTFVEAPETEEAPEEERRDEEETDGLEDGTEEEASKQMADPDEDSEEVLEEVSEDEDGKKLPEEKGESIEEGADHEETEPIQAALFLMAEASFDLEDWQLYDEVITTGARLAEVIDDLEDETPTIVQMSGSVTLTDSLNIDGKKQICFYGVDSDGAARITATSNQKLYLGSGSDLTLIWVNVTFTGGVTLYAEEDAQAYLEGLEMTGYVPAGNYTASDAPMYLAAGARVQIHNSHFYENNLNKNSNVIYASNAELEVSDSTFIKNGSDGIYAWSGKLDIESCFFDETQGYGLNLGSATVQVRNSTFQSGARSVINMSDGEVTITGSSFLGNSTTGSGGAINARRGSVIRMENCLFENNRTGQNGGGGAIYYDQCDIRIVNSTFRKNHADNMGGAILGHAGSVYIGEGTRIVENSARTTAGIALGTSYVVNTSVGANLTIEGGALGSDRQVEISDNEGRGISVHDSPDTVTIKNALIQNNTTPSGQNGAGIAMSSVTAVFSNTKFDSNRTGKSGGGIYVEYSDLTIDNVEMKNNHADWYGGVIYLYESEVTVENSAVTENTATLSGGALYVHNGTLNTVNTAFSGNEAEVSGGAVYAGRSTLKIGGSSFTENTAKDNGGAFYILYSDAVLTGGAFDGNETESHGGAFYIYDSAVGFTEGTFTGNQSAKSGGALYVYNYDDSLFEMTGATLSENEAGNHGGAMYLVYTIARILDTDIIDNQAESYGGGICAYYAALEFRGASEQNRALVSGNRGGPYGGGLYLDGYYQSAYEIHNVTLDGNEAYNGGGIAVRNASQLNGSHLDFLNNEARNNGGGMSVSRASITSEYLGSLENLTFANNRARLPVNVLSQADYVLYKSLLDAGALEGIAGSSLDNGILMSEFGFDGSAVKLYYLNMTGSLVELPGSAYRAYNNFDLAYNEMIYQLDYALHGGVVTDGAGLESSSIIDSNYYGAGLRSVGEDGAGALTAYLTDKIPAVQPAGGMAFTGWSQSLEGDNLGTNEAGAPVIDLNKLNGHKITLHARYRQTTLHVTFDAEGGSFAPEASGLGTMEGTDKLHVPVQYGGDVDEPSEFVSKAGFVFGGWYTEDGLLADLTEITKSMTVYADWIDYNETTQFLAVFHISRDSGEVFYSQSYAVPPGVIDLSAAKSPGYHDPERPGYTFDAWYWFDGNDYKAFDFGTVFTVGQEVHLYGEWTAKPYKFLLKNDENSEEAISVTVLRRGETQSEKVLAPGEELFMTDSTVEHVFKVQWADSARLVRYPYYPLDGSTEAELYGLYRQITNGYELYDIRSNIGVTLEMETRRYTVAFFGDEQDEVNIASYQVKYGATLQDALDGAGESLPVPTRPGYTLSGWKYGMSKMIAPVEGILNDPVYQNINYVAVWEETPEEILVEKPQKALTLVNGTPYEPDSSVTDGDTLTYTITAQNVKAGPHGLSLVDSLPGSLTVDPSSVVMTYDGEDAGRGGSFLLEDGVLTATFPAVEEGETVTLRFTAEITTPPVGSRVRNTVMLCYDDEAQGPTDEVETLYVPKEAEGEAPVKTLSLVNGRTPGTTATAGDKLTYTIEAKNFYEEANQLVIRDRIPVGTSFLSATAAYKGHEVTLEAGSPKLYMAGIGELEYDGTKGAVIWTFYDLAGGEAVTLTLTVQVDGAILSGQQEEIRNQATLDIRDTELDSNEVVTPLYEYFKVSYVANGGTGVVIDGESPYREGAKVVVLPHTHSAGNSTGISRSGNYTFQSWNTKQDGSGITYRANETFTITEDTVLYAIWKYTGEGGGGSGGGDSYYVVYDGNGGVRTGGQPSRQYTLAVGAVHTVLSNSGSALGFQQAGYTFQGWSRGGNAVNTQVGDVISGSAGETITLYAVWKSDDGNEARDFYTVTYHPGGATGGSVPVDSKEYRAGDTVTVLANPGSLSRSGYYFNGWGYMSAEGARLIGGNTFAIYGDVELYAKWVSRSSVTRPPEIEIPDAELPLIALNRGDHIWYLQGYPDDSVQPERALTRAEAAVIFYRLTLSEDKLTAYTADFSDMSPEDWYYAEVAFMAKHGIITGYEDGSFRGSAPITRAEFAAIASRYEALHLGSEVSFSDVPEGHWALAYVASATQRGWVAGYPDGTFRPNQNILRAETAAFVNRVLDRVLLLEDVPEGVRSYRDLERSHWAYCDLIEASHTHDFERKTEGELPEFWLEGFWYP